MVMEHRKDKEAMVKGKRNKKDYISALPDDLLHHMLSFLPSTKETIKTSVLSKRWRHVWTHVPNLVFLKNDFLEDSCQNVVACLDKTLSLHSSSKVKKFCIKLEDDMDGELLCPRMESWLSSVVGREVEDLTLDFYVERYQEGVGYSEGYFLPQFLYQNSCLLKLKTKFCHFVPNGRISWESLKVLKISVVSLSDQLMQNILQGTPYLHYLKLYACYGFHRLDLSLNTHLKLLVVEDDGIFSTDDGSLLQISGPYLEDLEILGNWNDMKFKLMNMSPSVKVTLDFQVNEHARYNEGYYGKIVKMLLHNVRHIKQLTLGNWCVQVLSKGWLDVMPSLSSNRKCLILDIYRFDLEWMYGIESLLLSSYELEKLVVNFGYSHNQFLSDAITLDCFWSSNTEVFNCLEFHLKTIEISGFDVSECCDEYGYDFLKFLLAKAKVLERMVIVDLIEKADKMLEVAKELLSYPRASPCAVILLEE